MKEIFITNSIFSSVGLENFLQYNVFFDVQMMIVIIK